jgi:hypothetical protein
VLFLSVIDKTISSRVMNSQPENHEPERQQHVTFDLYSVRAITDKEFLRCGILAAPQQLALGFWPIQPIFSQERMGEFSRSLRQSLCKAVCLREVVTIRFVHR